MDDLKARLRFNKLASRASLLVATATAQEYAAARNFLRKRYDNVYDDDLRAIFKVDDRITIVAMCLGQSPQTFGIRCARSLVEIAPKAAVIVGVCGSDRSEVLDQDGYGKVLVSNAAFNYERGKHSSGGEGVTFKPEYNWFYSTMRDSRLQQYIGEHEDNAGFHMYKDVVAFVCGSAVRADQPDILQRVRDTSHRNAFGLDMESAAFLEACTRCGVYSLGIFKAVLDLMGPEKTAREETYGFAAGRAAHDGISFFFWHFRNVENHWENEVTEDSADSVAKPKRSFWDKMFGTK